MTALPPLLHALVAVVVVVVVVVAVAAVTAAMVVAGRVEAHIFAMLDVDEEGSAMNKTAMFNRQHAQRAGQAHCPEPTATASPVHHARAALNLLHEFGSGFRDYRIVWQERSC